MKIELVKTQARRLYTPGATSYQTLWHVRIRAGNGRIIMSSETYSDKTAARRAAKWIADRTGRTYYEVVL